MENEICMYKNEDNVRENYCLPLKDFLCILNTHYTYTTRSTHCILRGFKYLTAIALFSVMTLLYKDV